MSERLINIVVEYAKKAIIFLFASFVFIFTLGKMNIFNKDK